MAGLNSRPITTRLRTTKLFFYTCAMRQTIRIILAVAVMFILAHRCTWFNYVCSPSEIFIFISLSHCVTAAVTSQFNGMLCWSKFQVSTETSLNKIFWEYLSSFFLEILENFCTFWQKVGSSPTPDFRRVVWFIKSTKIWQRPVVEEEIFGNFCTFWQKVGSSPTPDFRRVVWFNHLHLCTPSTGRGFNAG